MTPAVIVFFIGSYLTGDLRDTGWRVQPLWWVGCYAVFVALNLAASSCRSRCR